MLLVEAPDGAAATARASGTPRSLDDSQPGQYRLRERSTATPAPRLRHARLLRPVSKVSAHIRVLPPATRARMCLTGDAQQDDIDLARCAKERRRRSSFRRYCRPPALPRAETRRSCRAAPKDRISSRSRRSSRDSPAPSRWPPAGRAAGTPGFPRAHGKWSCANSGALRVQDCRGSVSGEDRAAGRGRASGQPRTRPGVEEREANASGTPGRVRRHDGYVFCGTVAPGPAVQLSLRSCRQ